MRHWRVATTVALSVGAVVAGAGPGFAAVAPLPGNTIYGYGGVCLDDRGFGTADGNPVQVYACNYGTNESWTVTTPQFGSASTITVFGKCLDVQGGGTANGAAVDIAGCNGGGSQQWILESNRTLVNVASGRCLDDPAWGGSGTALQIWDCNGGDNQGWEISGLPSSG